MEYELSFNNFNYRTVIGKIKKKGKKIHGFYPFRVTYFFLAGAKSFKKGAVRVRDEYPGKVTITTKKYKGKFPEEYETRVDASYEETVKMVEKTGLKKQIETVKLREKWSFDKCHEIVFDLWPGLPLIMEIDCSSKKSLDSAIKYLGVNKLEGYTHSKYDYTLGIPFEKTSKIKVFTFKNYRQLLPKMIKKNKELFDKLDKKYYMSFLSKANQEKYINIF